MAVTRVRDCEASRATSECVNPFLTNYLNDLIVQVAAELDLHAFGGCQSNTFASSLALRARTGLTFSSSLSLISKSVKDETRVRK